MRLSTLLFLICPIPIENEDISECNTFPSFYETVKSLEKNKEGISLPEF